MGGWLLTGSLRVVDMKIYHQSVFDRWPFEDGSMQAIVTSPPYWGLRKYDIPDIVIGGDRNCEHEWVSCSRYWDNRAASLLASNGTVDFCGTKDSRGQLTSGFCSCGGWKGQYGLEPSYKDYIEHTVLWAREAWRVLKDDGIFFLNIGDSYCGGGRGSDKKFGVGREGQPESFKGDDTIVAKCKMLIPHRVAIALIDDGWTLRNDLIWHKPNGMPESCQDRFSKKFEYIFMLVKSEKYYFDLDAIRVPWDEDSIARLYRGNSGDGKYSGESYGGNQPSNTMSTRRPNRTKEYKTQDPERKINIKGKNPCDMWSINTSPSPEKHFAMKYRKS